MRPVWLVSYFAIVLETDERIINALNGCYVFERCEFVSFLENIRAEFRANASWVESTDSIPNSPATSIDFWSEGKELIMSDRLLYLEKTNFYWYDDHDNCFESYSWELGYKITMRYFDLHNHHFAWADKKLRPDDLKVRILSYIS